MQNKGLLFIPDISGFTRFVNETDIAHSRLIIQELLETIINSNQIGLEVSEVEGDAVLFYKFCNPPSLGELFAQIERTFCSFHQSLTSYELRRYCQCNACMSAVNLSLKIITHYGEFSTYSVKNFRKLIGKDIIVAHQLLKNDIEQHEYWLVTTNILDKKAPESLAQWMKWIESSKKTDSGEIQFMYTQLGELKGQVKPTPPAAVDLSKMMKVVSVSHDYATELIPLFHATGDFNYRHLWMEGVIRVEEVGHFLPRVGMRCRCVLKDREVITTASSYRYSTERIEFTETEEDSGNTTHFLLEKVDNGRARCTLSYYVKKNILSYAVFITGKAKAKERSLRNSLNNIESLLPQIKLPPPSA